MAEVVGNILGLILAIASLFFLLWSVGLTFPFANEQSLARSIIGRRGITRVPSRAHFAYLAALMMAAAAAAVLLGGFSERIPDSKPYLAPVGLLLAFVFLGRGIAGVLPAVERAAPEEPFLTLNRRFYSPLCAVVGIGFLFMTLALPNWSSRLGHLFS